MESVAVVLFIWLLQCSLGTYFEGCESPQYLQYRRPGAIHCSFDANISAVFWYDSLDIIFNDPIVTLIDSVKGGQGYRSGEFDITSDGSLLINEVNTNHGKNFSVATFISLDDEPSVYRVAVVIEGIHLDGCDSPQYLEYGGTGIIHCRFQKNFDRVFWYNSTETLFDLPILTYTQSDKGGRAYDTGEFDVFPNGSLIIREVRLVHEHTYTVAKFTSADEDPIFYAVAVIVIVKSFLAGPVIDKCESNSTICFTELDGSSAVNCIVQGARPAVSLKWLTLTSSGYHNISSKLSSFSNNVTFTTRTITLDAFAYSPVLSLLVCKAEFAPGVLQRGKSFVLVQNSQKNLSSITPVTKYALRGSILELHCTGSTRSYLQVVWKRSLSFDNQYQNIMFGVLMEHHFETKYNGHLHFGENGSLILRQVDPQDDGFYGCIYGDGITDGMTKYEVVTYVIPVPPYPVVEGCNYENHCVLEVNRKGNLTCSVTGIRPEVTLMWRESNKTPSGKITFFEHNPTVIESGGTFNITLTSSYSTISMTRVTVKCGAFGPGSVIFPSHSSVDLLFVPGNEPDDSSVPTRNHSARIIIVLMGMVVVFFGGMTLFISAGYLYRKKKRRKEAVLKVCEIIESLPVSRSDKGNQSSSGKFATYEETADFQTVLLFLSRHLGDDWINVARSLLLEESQIYQIKADYWGSLQESSYHMLLLWKWINGPHATLDALIGALKEAGREDLAYKIQGREDYEEESPFLLKAISEDVKEAKLQEDLDKKNEEKKQHFQSQQEDTYVSEELKKKVKELLKDLNKLQLESQERGAQIQKIKSQLTERDKKVTKLQEDLNKKDIEIQLLLNQVEEERLKTSHTVSPQDVLYYSLPTTTNRQDSTQAEDSEEMVFLFLSRNLTHAWRAIGRRLTLSDETLSRIQQENINSVQNAVYKMLETWKKQRGHKATYSVLIQALIKEGRRDLAEDLQNREDEKVTKLQEDLNKKDIEIQLLLNQVEEERLKVYRMVSQPRGLAVIINNRHFRTMPDRRGTEVDGSNLQHVFKELGFSVDTKSDVEAQEMAMIVKELCEMNHSNFDCVALAVLTHGVEGTLYGVDERTLLVEDLLKYFDADRAPTLIGKPKIIILEATRGERIDRGIELFDATEAGYVEEAPPPLKDENAENKSSAENMLKLELETPDAFASTRYKLPCRSDMIVVYCTVPGFVSWRNVERGSWFIQAFTEVMLQYAESEDLLSMLTMVNAKVAKAFESSSGRYKQMPAPVNMLTKKLFFFPGYFRE